MASRRASITVNRMGWTLASLATLLLVIVLLGIVASVGGARLGVAVPVVERLYTRFLPPNPTVERDLLLPKEREAVTALGRRMVGRFMWSSNRGGNHEIYSIDLQRGVIRQLTTDPHVDFFSRFSPDGRRISFLRSRRTWVSFREVDGWDLYVMDANGGDERRLAEHAYHPTWAPDGKRVVFLRSNRVMQVELDTGREALVFDGDRRPTEGSIGDAELADDGLLTLSLRDGTPPRGVGVLNLATRTYRALSGPRACHSTWKPGGREVVWIDAGGHGGTRVMHSRIDAVAEQVLIDLPGSASHEYFPRVANDGRWLVWGAAAEGHEHDRADYEIFAWPIGEPWKTAIRLTWSKANDQWPDLFVSR